jgi:hypothetical protein
MRYPPSIKKYFQNFQGLLRNLKPILKTLIYNIGKLTTKEKQIQNSQQNEALYVILLHDSCMKNKAHRTLVEARPQTTHQTGVEGRKYIFSSMQYNLWHSSC